MRYDELLDAEALGRDAAVSLVEQVREWATGRLG
jgi:hypothetical protein